MKTKLILLLAASSLAVGMTSCSDFLQEDNKVGETSNITYTTKAGIDGLLASCYSFQRGWYGKEPSLGLTEGGTDLFYYGHDNKQKTMNSYNVLAASNPTDVNDNPCFDSYWEMDYDAIDVCNNLIKYAATCGEIDDATKKQYTGEAQFLKSLTYFNMVNMWGAIPYNDAPVAEQNTNPIRMPENEVYGKILASLDSAIENLSTVTSKASGHATVWSARALKARVLLYAASWLAGQKGEKVAGNEAYSNLDAAGLYNAAAQEADAVISGSGASLYANYKDEWTLANEDWTTNKEALFGIAYSGDLSSTSNCIPRRYVSSSGNDDTADQYNSLITRTGYTRGGSVLLMMFVPLWNNGCNDLGGDGTGTTNVFYRATKDGATITSKKTGQPVLVSAIYSPYSRGFMRYLPTLHFWNLLAKNKATDQRYEGTLLDHYNIANHDLSQNAVNYPDMGKWADANLTGVDLQAFRDTAIFYSNLDGNSPEGQAMQAKAKNRYRIQFASGGDIPVYTTNNEATAVPTELGKVVSDVYGDARYNDPKVGGWESFPCICKFLDDVYNPEYPTYDLSARDCLVLRLPEMYLIKAEAQLQTGDEAGALNTVNILRDARAIPGMDNKLTSVSSIDDILDERAIELCGEYQRWFDLKRTGKLVEYVKKYNAQGAANIKDYHVYRPIPDAQITSVTNFTATPNSMDGFWQNPGYN